MAISIRAPLAGCDARGYIIRTPFGWISIRAPLAGCDVIFAVVSALSGISIRAPLAGCDTPSPWHRAPCAIFQSAHPLRGATLKTLFVNRLRTISIRAPLAGCDALRVLCRHEDVDFNPRTPCGVRHVQPPPCIALPKFQSAHPLRGATHWDASNTVCSAISIRAPHAGCDCLLQMLLPTLLSFQSAHPMRGATMWKERMENPDGFQSAHPMRGATVALQGNIPCRGISIRAPHAGCDGKNAQTNNKDT